MLGGIEAAPNYDIADAATRHQKGLANTPAILLVFNDRKLYRTVEAVLHYMLDGCGQCSPILITCVEYLRQMD